MKLILSLLIPMYLMALSDSQKFVKYFVKNEAAKWCDYKTLIGEICRVETSWGLNLIGDNGKSFGVFQIQVATARDVARHDKSLAWLNKLSDNRIAVLLLTDMKLSTEITCKLFNHSMKTHTVEESISRHTGVWKNTKYVKKVLGGLK